MKDGKTANDARIRELVEAESPYLTFTNDDQNIVCVLNNHEIPVRLEALEAFVRCGCMTRECFFLGHD